MAADQTDGNVLGRSAVPADWLRSELDRVATDSRIRPVRRRRASRRSYAVPAGFLKALDTASGQMFDIDDHGELPSSALDIISNADYGNAETSKDT